MTLGETIKLLRNELGLTQPELAEKAQIEQSYLSKLENDKGTPSFDIINRIAMALGLNGMELVNRLSHSYIAAKLSHIPEVAAEYASIREQHLNWLKRYYLIAAMLIVLGVGLIFTGTEEVLFPEHTYMYESMGVIREGETPWQYSNQRIHSIGETGQEEEERRRANADRIDPAYLTSYEFRGFDFWQDVEGGGRYFHMVGDSDDKRWQNRLVSVLGTMLLTAGLLTIVFVERFKAR